MSGDAHIAYRQGKPVELEVDFAVVGSGAGGATAAVTLARAGHRVALVEAGAYRDPHDYPHSVRGTLRDMMPMWGSTAAVGRAIWPIVQGSVVGGSTVINSAIAVATPGDVFQRWQQEHGLDGELAEHVWRAQEGLAEELHAAEVSPNTRGRHNQLAKQGADRLGFESHYLVRYARDCQGSGQCLQGCRGGRKQSLNLNFVPEVMARGGHVLSCAPVQKIAIAGGAAIGVRGRFVHPQHRKRGARFFVRARRGVLVAASVTQSCNLLRASGLRGAALGQGFRAHPGAPVIGLYDTPVDMNTGVTQGWASTAFRTQPGLKLETLSLPLDMLAGRIKGAGPTLMARLRDFRHMAIFVQATRAESTGRIARNPLGRPVVHYGLDRADMERFRIGLGKVAEMHFAAGARAIAPGIHGLPYALGPDELDRLRNGPLDPRAYVAVLSHLFGGCAMGADARTSVVDGRGRVHGVERLRVVDASVIPSNLGVNPQHTIMALSRVFAEHMA